MRHCAWLMQSAAAVAALLPVAGGASVRAANFYWKQSVVSGAWSNPANWSAVGPTGGDTGGVPNASGFVYITPTDGQPHTVSYDYTGAAVSLNLLQVSLAGNPADAATLNMTGNSLTAHTTYIGYSGVGGTNGSGAMAQSGGTYTITSNGNGFYLGLNPTDKGSYTLAGGSIASNNAQYVGLNGTGTFTQSGGVNVLTPGFNFLSVGHAAGSTGTYSLSGGSLTANQGIYVGYSGRGTFTQTGGVNTVQTSSGLLIVGYQAGANGLYVLSGGTLAVPGNSVAIGSAGNGTMNHSAGTALINNHLYVGTGVGSRGVYNLSGSGSLTTLGQQFIGYEGVGTVNQSGGSNSAPNFYLGYNQSSTGTYSLSGGTLSAGQVFLGNAPGALGSLTLTGGRLSATNVYIGFHENSTGMFSLANGHVSISNVLSFGLTGLFSMSGGTLSVGALQYTIQAAYFNWSGGTITTTGGVFRLPYSQSTNLSNPFGGTFIGADAQNNAWTVDNIVALSAPGTITVGTAATPRHLAVSSGGNNGVLALNHPNAAVVVHGNAYVSHTAAGPTGVSGTLTISAGSMNVSGILQFPVHGRVRLSGGMLSVSGVFNDQFVPMEWTGGTLTVTASTFSGATLYSQSGFSSVSLFSNQVGNFHGGSDANMGFFIRGQGGSDTFSQSGPSTINVGTAAVPRHLAIGYGGATTSYASYLLSHPAAALTVHGNAYVGGSPSARGPIGSLGLTNGNATVHGTLKLWNAGTLSLAGGTLTAGHIDASLNPSGIHWTGGHLRLGGGTIFGVPALTVPAAGTLGGVGSFLGNVTLNGAIALGSAHHLSVAGVVAGPGSVTTAAGSTLAVHALRASSLSVGGTAQLLPANAGASRLNALVIAGTSNNWTGQLDLTNNPLILQTAGGADKAARLATLQNQVLSGKAGGSWLGRGVTSTTAAADPATLAVAVADNADLNFSTFRGQAVDANSLLLSVAQFGDANLDGKVDAFDLNLLASHWQQLTNAAWSAGDFNHDGGVNAFDLNLLAAHWQAGTAGSLEAALSAAGLPAVLQPAAVPEPSTLALLALAGPMLMPRRRGRGAAARG